jgi:hypothetical protein
MKLKTVGLFLFLFCMSEQVQYALAWFFCLYGCYAFGTKYAETIKLVFAQLEARLDQSIHSIQQEVFADAQRSNPSQQASQPESLPQPPIATPPPPSLERSPHQIGVTVGQTLYHWWFGDGKNKNSSEG